MLRCVDGLVVLEMEEGPIASLKLGLRCTLACHPLYLPSSSKPSLRPQLLAILAPLRFLARDRYGSVIKALNHSGLLLKFAKALKWLVSADEEIGKH
jgi:hypothetical protein